MKRNIRAKASEPWSLPPLWLHFLVFVAWLLYFKPKMADIFFEPVFVNDVKKVRLVSEMRVNLNASVEAEKSAVLADTDELSHAYADQTLRLSATVEDARLELGVLIEAEKMGREVIFSGSSAPAGEVPANRPGTVAAVRTEHEPEGIRSFVWLSAESRQTIGGVPLRPMNSGVSNDKACGITRLSLQTLSAALKIHALQSPHIAESRPDKMDEIEATIQAQDAQVNQSLDALSFLMNPKSKPLVEAAKAALCRVLADQHGSDEAITPEQQCPIPCFVPGSKNAKPRFSARIFWQLSRKTIQSKVYKATR